jgi:hypothetical protein
VGALDQTVESKNSAVNVRPPDLEEGRNDFWKGYERKLFVFFVIF